MKTNPQKYNVQLTEDQITLIVNALMAYVPFSSDLQTREDAKRVMWDKANAIAMGDVVP